MSSRSEGLCEGRPSLFMKRSSIQPADAPPIKAKTSPAISIQLGVECPQSPSSVAITQVARGNSGIFNRRSERICPSPEKPNELSGPRCSLQFADKQASERAQKLVPARTSPKFYKAQALPEVAITNHRAELPKIVYKAPSGAVRSPASPHGTIQEQVAASMQSPEEDDGETTALTFTPTSRRRTIAWAENSEQQPPPHPAV